MHTEQVTPGDSGVSFLSPVKYHPATNTHQLRAVGLRVVTFTLSVSFSFGDQKSVRYFHFLILMQEHEVRWGGLGDNRNPLSQMCASTSAGWVLMDEVMVAREKKDICLGAEVKCRRLKAVK